MATKKYQDRYWITVTLKNNHKIVIGCANWHEATHIEANFKYHVPSLEPHVVRVTRSSRIPKIDRRKYKATYLSRAQAEKRFPELFKRLTMDMLERVIREEDFHVSRKYCGSPKESPYYDGVSPPKFHRVAKDLLREYGYTNDDMPEYKRENHHKRLAKIGMVEWGYRVY